ncbi:MAG: putative DNA modification/repair radical SAM protein [bacterium]
MITKVRIKIMGIFEKAKILGDAAKYDICLSSCIAGGRAKDPKDPVNRWIYPASLPDGKTTFLLKVLLSNECENDCKYCINRCGRDFARVSFEPEELVKLFIELYRNRSVHGLFLSSGVAWGINQTMGKMIKVVEILRKRYRFKGYIHLKILPGANFSYVERATQLANRVSLNLESPTQKGLSKISNKDIKNDIYQRMKWIDKIISTENLRVSQTTQFVVGASDESDYELLKTTDWLYKNLNLARTYFSAFQPIENTPLESHPPTPLMREHRLYQADFLLRRYGFKFDELKFDEGGNLPLNLDPKMVFALTNMDKFPIEINKASKEELLRVPGIGPISAARIIKSKNKFHTLDELKKVGVVIKRAAKFILIDGKLPHNH